MADYNISARGLDVLLATDDKITFNTSAIMKLAHSLAPTGKAPHLKEAWRIAKYWYNYFTFTENKGTLLNSLHSIKGDHYTSCLIKKNNQYWSTSFFKHVSSYILYMTSDSVLERDRAFVRSLMSYEYYLESFTKVELLKIIATFEHKITLPKLEYSEDLTFIKEMLN